MRCFLFLLCFMLIAVVPIVATAGDCSMCPIVNGACTIESTVSAEVAIASTAGHPVLAVARRSVGTVGKAVAVPVRIIKNVASIRPARTALKAVAKIKPARRAVALGGRLICPRCRGSE